MGRSKPNKPKRERAMFGSQEMGLCVAEAVSMSLRSNSISAVTGARAIMAVRNFENFDMVIEAMAHLEGMEVDIFLVIPDVIELECRLADLPNLDKGISVFDTESRRTARVYRYDNTQES